MGCFDPKKSESKSASTSKTGGQNILLQDIIDKFRPTLDAGPNIFPGSRVAPFSELQKQATAGVDNFADLFSTPQQVGTPLFDETGTAIRDTLAGTTGAKDIDPGDFFEKSVREPTLRNLERDVLPGIDEDFAGPGFFGSARSQERTQRRQETSEFLGEQKGRFDLDIALRNQDITEARAGRTLAAVPGGLAFGQVPAQEARNNLEIAARQIGGLEAIFGFGQATQTQAQIELQDEILRFAEENQIVDPENLSILLALLDLNFSSSRGSSSSSGAGLGFVGASAAAKAFGTAAGGAGATAVGF